MSPDIETDHNNSTTYVPPESKHSNSTMPPPSSRTSTPSHDQALAEENARLKRELVRVTLDLNTAQHPQQHSVSPRMLGRRFSKSVSLFEDLATLIAEYDRREDLKSMEHDERTAAEAEDVAGMDQEEFEDRQYDRDRRMRGLLEVFRQVPSIKRLMNDENPDRLESFMAAYEKGSKDNRGEDVKHSRAFIAKLLNGLTTIRRVGDPLLDPDSRANRGWSNYVTGYFLCPIEWDWLDQSVRNKIQNGDPEFDPAEIVFIRAFYRNYTGDPSHFRIGLFMSPLLVALFRFFYTTPTSALNIDVNLLDMADDPEQPLPKRRRSERPLPPPRKSVAQIMHMTEVTGRTIAYTAVMLYISLTNLERYAKGFDGFSLQALYNFVVDFFEAPETPAEEVHIKNVLAWWNEQIFPNTLTVRHPSGSAMSSRTRLRAQRRQQAQAAAL